MPDPQVIILATLAVSLVLFVTDALRYDLIALLVVLVLAGTRVLEPREAFSGFSSPAIVLIASMYVFGTAMTKTGVAEWVAQKTLIPAGGSEVGLAVRVVLVSGLLSSVLSNTGVVAALIPVLHQVARKTETPISRLLMPLAIGSLLGGMITVIGTSTNIAVNSAIADSADPRAREFGLYEFGHFGLLCLAIGAVYVASPFRKLLPRRRVDESLTEHYQVPKFVSEVLVEPSSTLINRTVGDADLLAKYEISVLGIAREGENSVLAPGPYNRIRIGDTLMLQGEPENLLRLRRDLGLRKREAVQVGDVRLEAQDVQLVEAVVPAASSLVGRSLRDANFQETTNLNVLAISKHGDLQPRGVQGQRLSVGDTLLIQGHDPDIERVRTNRELLILGAVELPVVGRQALKTLAILAALLVVVSFGLAALSVAALGGAVALVASNTVKPDEVRRAIDWPVLVLIGGMLSLGVAFREHELDQLVAKWMLSMGDVNEHPRLLLLLLLTMTTLLTQAMNHVTSAVVMTPVALAFASLPTSIDPTATPWNPATFLMAVVVGGNLCFLSPVAHQVNAMVMGPGEYRFMDFVKVGLPLTLLLMGVAILLVPYLWPFYP